LENIIRLEKITKKYGNETVLENLSFGIKKGEILAVLGISGIGKTTLLRIIAGLESVEEGKVFIKSQIATDGKKIIIPPYKRKIGFIFQNLGLWEHMSVWEHIEFITKDKRKITEILRKFELLEHKDKKPYQLSGGQKQRLAIARVFAQDVEILLLDEPFSNLDMIRKKQLREEILNLKNEKNLTVIYVTHDPIDVKIMSTKVAVLHNKKIIQSESYQQLILNPVSQIVKDLLSI
jgi:ABC-type sugar transport system ATPase subunit